MMSQRSMLLAVQAVVTVALLAFIFGRVDWVAFRAALSRITPAFYAASLLATIAGHMAYAFRWRVVLDAMEIRVRYPVVLQQYLIGLFFGNVLPTSIGGDAAKLYYLGRRTGYTDAGASLFVDRFLGLLWLSIGGTLLAWSAASRDSLGPAFDATRLGLTIIAAALTAIVALAALAAPLVDRPSTGSRARWRQIAIDLLRRVRDAVCRPTPILVAALVVGAYQLMMAGVYDAYFRLNGVEHPPFAAILAALVGMAVFVNIPVTLNGVGLREQLHVMLFATMGLAREAAVSISLLMFSHALLLSAAGGIAWLRVRHTRA